MSFIRSYLKHLNLYFLDLRSITLLLSTSNFAAVMVPKTSISDPSYCSLRLLPVALLVTPVRVLVSRFHPLTSLYNRM
jgi:hypothetical protein